MSIYNLVIPQQYNNEKDTNAINKFFDLDLEPIKFKMIKSAEEKGEKVKDLSELDVTEIYYKLFLLKRYFEPSKRISPSCSVDAMWHTHILDTQKYAEDCDFLFGEFVHHNPYFGIEETDSLELLKSEGEDFLNFSKMFIPDCYQQKNDFKRAACSTQPTLCDIFKDNVKRPRVKRSSPLVFNFN